MLSAAFLPVYQNPYQHLLADALRHQGIQIEFLDTMPPREWLHNRRQEVEILHIHWLYGLYMRGYWTPLSSVQFVDRFLLAKRLGYRVVWTAHNIVPHKMPFPPLHLAIRRFVTRRADAIITHCEFGGQELARRFVCQGPIHVVPHGNYVGVHPVSVSRAQARAGLNIPLDAFVYLLLGNISPYKGIETAVDTVHRQPDTNSIVLIAGRNRAPDLVSRLEAISARDPRIRLCPGFVPDDQMQYYLLAADVMVCSFRQILSSGSVILGMSYGLPIIAPHMGCLPELVAPSAGILYDPADSTALAHALNEIKRADTEAMGREAKAIADTLQWDGIARHTADIYQACLEKGR